MEDALVCILRKYLSYFLQWPIILQEEKNNFDTK